MVSKDDLVGAFKKVFIAQGLTLFKVILNSSTETGFAPAFLKKLVFPREVKHVQWSPGHYNS